MARRIAVVMSTGLIPDRNTREKAPLTPLSTALSKRSKILIVVLSSFPRAVRATYGVGGSEAAPSHSLAVARTGVAPTAGMFPMSKGLRARIEGPSWQGIPCHDAPVTFGAHVTRVTISVSEQTECGQVVSHVLVLHGCILGSRLPSGMECVGDLPDVVHIAGCYAVHNRSD